MHTRYRFIFSIFLKVVLCVHLILDPPMVADVDAGQVEAEADVHTGLKEGEVEACTVVAVAA